MPRFPADDPASDALDLLIKLCECDPPAIDGAVLSEDFRLESRLLLSWGALCQEDPPALVWCRACSEGHAATPIFDGVFRTYSHRCPEAGLVAVDLSDLISFRVDLSWFVGELASAAGTGPTSSVVDEHFWDLGEGRLGDQAWSCFFARRLSLPETFARIRDALPSRAGRPGGLILTTSPGSSVQAENVGGHQIIDVRHLLSATSSALEFDSRVLVARLRKITARHPAGSGLPGRPSAKELYVAEHARRVGAGLTCFSVWEEAKALHAWMAEEHPLEPKGTVGTIENNIRSAHNAWKSRRTRTPGP